MDKKIFNSSVVLLGLMTLAGIGAWIYQLINGLGVTGMNNGTSWGLYIACFMFMVGLSAGGLIVASSASIFHIEAYKKVALPAILVSTISVIMAVLFVTIDIGSGVFRGYNFLLHPNLRSPLIWDITVISCYLSINLVYLYLMTSEKADAGKIGIVSRFALPTAILVHSVTAWIFGLQIAREGWHSAIMAPLFVASAMDSGLAMLLIVLLVLRKMNVFYTDQKIISSLAALLATCVAVDGFFVGCEMLTAFYPGTEAGMEILSEMFTGSMALFFWSEIIVGVAIPFSILVFAKNRNSNMLIMIASAGVVIGVFCKRIWLLLTSFIHSNISGAPGLISGSSASAHSSGTAAWATVSSYAPTWVEFLIVIGVFSAGILAFMLLVKLFCVDSGRGIRNFIKGAFSIVAIKTRKA
ncbi:MAG: NrfD/PsrC family molybdoenzyme membrane anchor subunit [Proteocatella sp.]